MKNLIFLLLAVFYFNYCPNNIQAQSFSKLENDAILESQLFQINLEQKLFKIDKKNKKNFLDLNKKDIGLEKDLKSNQYSKEVLQKKLERIKNINKNAIFFGRPRPLPPCPTSECGLHFNSIITDASIDYFNLKLYDNKNELIGYSGKMTQHKTDNKIFNVYPIVLKNPKYRGPITIKVNKVEQSRKKVKYYLEAIK